MKIGEFDIGVCSWSLRAKDVEDLVAKTREVELSHVQLALGMLQFLDDKRKHQQVGLLRQSGITITGGMIGFPGEDYSSIATIRQTGGFLPDEQWEVRRKIALDAGKLAQELSLSSVSTHVGFIPPSSDARYPQIVERVGGVAREYGEMGLDMLMETGQERAPELLQFLNDCACRTLGVNFDPANMLLYGSGDPAEAVRTLGRHIRHVHVKDAKMSDQPGVKWGVEYPFGAGDVGAKQFIAILREVNYDGPLVIEREGGDDRIADVRTAVESLRAAI